MLSEFVIADAVFSYKFKNAVGGEESCNGYRNIDYQKYRNKEHKAKNIYGNECGNNFEHLKNARKIGVLA